MTQRDIIILSLIALFCLQSPTIIIAAEKQSDIIYIEADFLTFDEKAAVNFYRGNVRLTQGELQVHAEELRIYSKNNILDKITANGKKDNAKPKSSESTPVRFRTRNEDGKEVIASANRLEYFENESRLILEGDAELSQGTNNIRSQRIEYLIDKQAVIAGDEKNTSDPANLGRVRMTITPTKKEKK